jgi:dTDP-4-dehydrorhamnose reductase
MSPFLLVTGGTGQLATALARGGAAVRVVGRPAFDFERPASIASALEGAPALVINAAAWTAVDAAETEPASAARANAAGPAQLAALCHAAGLPFIHISTDYVFDGLKGAPYTEQDAPNPTGVYGRTKLAGEAAVLAAHPGAVILRTSWVYAETGRNFVRTMLGAARRMPVLRVVSDQIGCPTNADDLAACVLAVADRLLDRPRAGLAGVTHAAGAGHTSWHGLACAIFEAAGRHGWPVPEVEAIATADWPTPATRPPDSRLDCTRLSEVFGASLPPWRPSLARAVAAICQAAPDG